MPRTRSLAWAELKFGLIAVFALVMAGLLIFAVGGGGGFFWQNYSLKVKFDNVAGLMAGSPVRVAGVEVGSVTDVELSATGVEVWFDDSRRHAAARHRPVAGHDRVDLAARRRRGRHHARARAARRSPNGATCNPGVAEGSIAAMTAQATPGINEATAAVEDIRKGRGTVGKLFTDDAVYREFNALRQRRRARDAHIADGRGTLGQLANNPKALQRARSGGRQPQRHHDGIAQRRGQPRQAAERSGACQIADADHRESRRRDRPAQSRRGHGGQAPHRRCALQAAGCDDCRASTRFCRT